MSVAPLVKSAAAIIAPYDPAADGPLITDGYTTTATAAGTTTLTASSSNQQYFTGATTQTVLLPAVSTLVLGFPFRVVNHSSGVVTVQSSGANTVQAMAADTYAIFTCILMTGTSAASWDVQYFTTGGGSGDVVGPVSAVSGNVALFDGTTGKLIEDGGTLGSAAYTASSAYDPAGSAAAAQAASQPLDATLTALAGVNWAANSLAIGSGSDTVAQVAFSANTFPARASTGNLVAKTITDFVLTIMDDADAATVRTTIGAGTGNGNVTGGGTCTGTSSGTNTGDQTITLTGDVTGSGTGSFAATIAADAVTNAKLANAAAYSFKGNLTSGSANPTDITLADLTAETTPSAGDYVLGMLASGQPVKIDIDDLPSGGGSGTVTSVGITAPAAGIAVSGSPITTSGNITLALNDDLAALESLSGTNTIYYRSATSTWTAVAIGGNLTFSGGTLAATLGSYILLEDQKTTGTDGGTFTTGAWQTRTLNTEVTDTGGDCTLSSNQFTLVAGTYELEAHASAYQVGRHQARLQNVTDATTVESGSSEIAGSGNNVTTHSHITARFTIASSKAFEIQHRCETTLATYGYGISSGAAFTVAHELYTRVIIRRVA